MKLKDKIAGVTGSVQGLGWEMVQAFAREGAKVVICDLTQSDVDAALARLGRGEDRFLGVRADVAVEQDVLGMFKAIVDKFGRLDVWVNNAGIAWPPGEQGYSDIAETPLENWLAVLNTNLTGAFLCGREAVKIMRAQRSGSIINISSNHGKEGKPQMGPYCASKFGIEGLTQVMALENEPFNIRINSLMPGGPVATAALLNNPRYRGMKLLKPEVIRACAVYLASDEAGGVTGQSLDAGEWNKAHGIPVNYVTER